MPAVPIRQETSGCAFLLGTATLSSCLCAISAVDQWGCLIYLRWFARNEHSSIGTRETTWKLTCARQNPQALEWYMLCRWDPGQSNLWSWTKNDIYLGVVFRNTASTRWYIQLLMKGILSKMSSGLLVRISNAPIRNTSEHTGNEETQMNRIIRD